MPSFLRFLSDLGQALLKYSSFAALVRGLPGGGGPQQVQKTVTGAHRGGHEGSSTSGPTPRHLHEPVQDPAGWQDPRGVEDLSVELASEARRLRPLIKRRRFELHSDIPQGWSLGWAQLPETRGQAFSLGIFPNRDHFYQMAVADAHGRVFAGGDPSMDTHSMEPVFVFGEEGTIMLDDVGRIHGHDRSKRLAKGVRKLNRQAKNFARTLASSARSLGLFDFGTAATKDGHAGLRRGESDPTHIQGLPALQGGILGRDDVGHMIWLASWIKRDNRYSIEQSRAVLPEYMRVDLEYRDALTIAFFATHFLPHMHDTQIGFGSGNIFRRLNHESPLGAIRRSVSDTIKAHAYNLRVSGLEDYFVDLMGQAGALETTVGLEPIHGSEPMRLYTSGYSGTYFFAWEHSLEFAPALKALKIEGNLNRFVAICAFLEHNASAGFGPTEDTVTKVQAAQIDMALLENPAMLALRPQDGRILDLHEDHGQESMANLVREAARTAREISLKNPDPAQSVGSTQGMSNHNHEISEWVYRQTMATVLRRLSLPFRFDVEYRSNLRHGKVALGFATAGPSMMPSSRYDEVLHDWVSLSNTDRATMSTSYNLRAGMIMAALAFGADESVDEVFLHIDSVGLEEAVAQQDSAIKELTNQALHVFEHMRTGDVELGKSKADPKDGDIHGDPTRTSPTVGGVVEPGNSTADPDSFREQTANRDEGDSRDMEDFAADMNQSQDSKDSMSDPDEVSREQEQTSRKPDFSASKHDFHPPQDPTVSSSDKDEPLEKSVNQEFKDLMQGIELDQTAFNVPQGQQADDQAFSTDDAFSSSLPEEGEQSDEGAEDADDPLSILQRSPTVRTLLSVRFDRKCFFEHLRQRGLSDPVDFYHMVGATMNIGANGGLEVVDSDFSLGDMRFSPEGSRDEPEFSSARFDSSVAPILGTDHASGLSIQREDLLSKAVADFHCLAANQSMASVSKAQKAMETVQEIGDPELNELATQVSSALIDDEDTPNLQFTLTKKLDEQRIKARDLLFSGQLDQAIETLRKAVEDLDSFYAKVPGVPRYFNSYAERVVYNRLFATPDELTVLIPDNLFYAHMELADVLAQFKGAKESLPQLNAMVSYAPAYPQSHMKLSAQLARDEDWDSARAACLNALRVSLDRNDAAYAYYRFAYAEWMRDKFDLAVAAYLMSQHIAPGQIPALNPELQELLSIARSQCIPVPGDVHEAAMLLKSHDLPVWPHIEVAGIVRDAARVCVDHNIFVPARTLSVAAIRMNDGNSDGIDMAQAQFIRSLSS